MIVHIEYKKLKKFALNSHYCFMEINHNTYLKKPIVILKPLLFIMVSNDLWLHYTRNHWPHYSNTNE